MNSKIGLKGYIMSLKTPRYTYRPFQYQQAHDFFTIQSNNFWLPSEVSMERDIQDWKIKLTNAEKDIIINTLRLFTQIEIAVQDNFWMVIPKLFKKPEIAMMCASFTNMEAVHQEGYSYLNDSLGLPESEFSAFVQEPSMKAKIDFFCKKTKDIPLFLATLAVLEGVSLYSSFAILMSFSMENKLLGVQQIVSFSVRDESLHSDASCWLFKKYTEEYPNDLTKETKADILDMVRTVVAMEDDYIDRVFQLAPEGVKYLTPKQLKNFVRYRANAKLHDLGLPMNWKGISNSNDLEWFNVMSGGIRHTEFLSGQRVDDYSQGALSFDKVKF
jgi:ribonucleoside-diphosphate reductase beta chain